MSFEIPDTITEHINKHWKPGQEMYIKLEKTSKYLDSLTSWFDEYSEKTIDVGPFINIKPYAYFEDEENSERIEFLFLCESIDNTKLETQHLEI